MPRHARRRGEDSMRRLRLQAAHAKNGSRSRFGFRAVFRAVFGDEKGGRIVLGLGVRRRLVENRIFPDFFRIYVDVVGPAKRSAFGTDLSEECRHFERLPIFVRHVGRTVENACRPVLKRHPDFVVAQGFGRDDLMKDFHRRFYLNGSILK